MKIEVGKVREMLIAKLQDEEARLKRFIEGVNDGMTMALLGDKGGMEQVWITHAGDSQRMIAIYRQRVEEVALYIQAIDIEEEFDKMSPELTGGPLELARKQKADKLKAKSKCRGEAWKTAIANLKESLLLEEAAWYDNPVSDEERVYHARRIHSTSAVLFCLTPGDFATNKGPFYLPNAKAAYKKAHDEYTKKHGKNPVWKGEELHREDCNTLPIKAYEAMLKIEMKDDKEA